MVKSRLLSAKDLAFGYRHSAIWAVVLSAKFALSPGNCETIKQEMERLTHLRELKQPLSTHLVVLSFKRPVGHFAGQLISESGLKGYRNVVSKFRSMQAYDYWSWWDCKRLWRLNWVPVIEKEHSGVTLVSEKFVSWENTNSITFTHHSKIGILSLDEI